MPDQTPEPLTDARLRQLRDDEYVCTNANERSMAAELIAARARIAELETEKDLQESYDQWLKHEFGVDEGAYARFLEEEAKNHG
jgi:hypothetical protein